MTNELVFRIPERTRDSPSTKSGSSDAVPSFIALVILRSKALLTAKNEAVSCRPFELFLKCTESNSTHEQSHQFGYLCLSQPNLIQTWFGELDNPKLSFLTLTSLVMPANEDTDDEEE